VGRSALAWVVGGAALALTASLAMAAALGGGDGGDAEMGTTTPVPGSSSLSDAVERANVHVEGVTTADVGGLIEELCSSRDPDRLADRVADLAVAGPDELRALVEGVGDGAEAHCPEVAAEHPELINDAYNAALGRLAG
jgi:hypothetical protein